jgi:hypothetical protein
MRTWSRKALVTAMVVMVLAGFSGRDKATSWVCRSEKGHYMDLILTLRIGLDAIRPRLDGVSTSLAQHFDAAGSGSERRLR